MGIFWGLFKVHIKFFGGKGAKKSSKKIAHNKKAFEVSRLQTVSNSLENQYQGKFFLFQKFVNTQIDRPYPPLVQEGYRGCAGVFCVIKVFPNIFLATQA